MSFISIRLPEQFIADTKEFANKDYRTIPQQIMYWAELGKKEELRNWQLEKMRVGLQQAQNNYVASEQDVSRVFNKCKIAK
jgi:hypothetical protein